MDPKTGQEKLITVSADDGIRPSTNLAGLSKLKPAFKKDGSTTAGIDSLMHFFIKDLDQHVLLFEVWLQSYK